MRQDGRVLSSREQEGRFTRFCEAIPQDVNSLAFERRQMAATHAASCTGNRACVHVP